MSELQLGGLFALEDSQPLWFRTSTPLPRWKAVPAVMNPPNPVTHLFRDDGRIPNNPTLPLVLYRGGIDLAGAGPLLALWRA